MNKRSNSWLQRRLSEARNSLTVVAAAIALTWFARTDSVLAVTVVNQVVAVSRTEAPGGGTFSTLSTAMINEAGQVAFRGILANTSSGIQGGGIYLWDNGATVALVRNGTLAPDGTSRFVRASLSGLDDDGKVTFYSELGGPTGQALDETGVYRSDGLFVTQIAIEGQAAPDGNGNLDEFVSDEFLFLDPSPPLNSGGLAAFGASLSGTSGGVNDNLAIYTSGGGGLTQVVREGQAPLDGNGVFASFGNPTLDDLGRSAFRAQLRATNGGTADDSAIYRGFLGPMFLEQIARAGQPAPGGGTFADFTSPAMSDNGQVAFQATFDSPGQGIFLGNFVSPLEEIVRSGQVIPGTASAFNFFDSPALNNAGETAFAASFNNSGANDTGIFRSDGSSLAVIAREGQAVPGGNVRFTDMGAVDLALNNNGDVAFVEFLDGPTGSDRGVFYYSDQFGLVAVARTGDPLLGGTIDNLQFVGRGNRGKNDLQDGLNDQGQVAFSFTLTDGRWGVAVATIVPEPAGLVLASTGGLLLMATRTRRRRG